jgi:hypothetical protein
MGKASNKKRQLKELGLKAVSVKRDGDIYCDSDFHMVVNGKSIYGRKNIMEELNALLCDDMRKDKTENFGTIAETAAVMERSIHDLRVPVISFQTHTQNMEAPLTAAFLLEYEQAFAWLLADQLESVLSPNSTLGLNLKKVWVSILTEMDFYPSDSAKARMSQKFHREYLIVVAAGRDPRTVRGFEKMRSFAGVVANKVTNDLLAEYDAGIEKNELIGMFSKMDAAKADAAKSMELAKADAASQSRYLGSAAKDPGEERGIAMAPRRL